MDYIKPERANTEECVVLGTYHYQNTVRIALYSEYHKYIEITTPLPKIAALYATRGDIVTVKRIAGIFQIDKNLTQEMLIDKFMQERQK